MLSSAIKSDSFLTITKAAVFTRRRILNRGSVVNILL